MKENFRLEKDSLGNVKELVTLDELEKCFDPKIHLSNLNIIWERLSI